jgi:hypothetical protein
MVAAGGRCSKAATARAGLDGQIAADDAADQPAHVPIDRRRLIGRRPHGARSPAAGGATELIDRIAGAADDVLVKNEDTPGSQAGARRWNQRAFVVVGAAFSGLALPVTGLLYHASGREWAAAHAGLGVLCVVFCAWHAALNRRPLRRYATHLASARHWNKRAVIVVGAALMGLTLPLTGLLDHVAGREWALVHAAPGVLCVVFCAWHAVLNRSALLRYARARMPACGLPVREVVAPVLLTAVLLAATVIHGFEA